MVLLSCNRAFQKIKNKINDGYVYVQRTTRVLAGDAELKPIMLLFVLSGCVLLDCILALKYQKTARQHLLSKNLKSFHYYKYYFFLEDKEHQQ
jgi:hypothetical protein